MWRSEPQIAVAVTFKIISLSSLITGSSTVSQVTLPGPCITAAFMIFYFRLLVLVFSSWYRLPGCRSSHCSWLHSLYSSTQIQPYRLPASMRHIHLWPHLPG